MSATFEKHQKRRLLGSYITIVLSISFILFLMGMFALFVINGQKLLHYFKEEVVISLFVADDAKKIELSQLTRSLKRQTGVKSITAVSKEEAAARFSKDIDEDFMSFLGTNPLQASIDVRLKADFVNSTAIEKFLEGLRTKKMITEVVYDASLVDLLDKNIKVIGFWVVLVSILFSTIAVFLIHNSIRLSVYTQRFTIKTMQLVGATKSAIRRPFIYQNLKLGGIAALVASFATASVAYYVKHYFTEFSFLNTYLELLMVLAGLVLLGLVIAFLSTFFAAQRYLGLKTDELYF